jgi:uncharacterized membrane protein (UPF0127 family)
MRMVLLATLAALAAECTRAPAEDFPGRSTSPAAPAPAASSAVLPTSPAAESNVGRCIQPTPAHAPAAVAPVPAAACPSDPEGNQRVPVVHVAFLDAAPAAVDAELVSSPHDTQRGLMYRRGMPEDRAMLFDLHVRDDHQFWMHNTCIPLDLMYIDEDGLIVGIVENAPTLDDTPRGVGCPSRYVLEVNAGWSRRHHVTAGQRMSLPAQLRSDPERR